MKFLERLDTLAAFTSRKNPSWIGSNSSVFTGSGLNRKLFGFAAFHVRKVADRVAEQPPLSLAGWTTPGAVVQNLRFAEVVGKDGRVGG